VTGNASDVDFLKYWELAFELFKNIFANLIWIIRFLLTELVAWKSKY
jgi:hypothetical protein